MKKIFLLLILSISIVAIISYKPTIRKIKEIQHFNYSNVDNVTIKYTGYGKIKIENVDDVNQIIEYLNSLELIEEKIPKKEQAYYEGDWEKYEKDLKSIGYFSVSINEDILYFSTRYVSVMVEEYDDNSHCNTYYIKNSDYNK